MNTRYKTTLFSLTVGLFSLGCGGISLSQETPHLSAPARAAVSARPPKAAEEPIETALQRRCEPQAASPFKPADPQRNQSSPIALLKSDRRQLALVADEDASAIHFFDIGNQSDQYIYSLPMAGTPAHLLALQDGRILVSLKQENRVAVLSLDENGRGIPLCELATPAEPTAMSADAGRWFVLSSWGGALSAFNAADAEPLFSIELPREPRNIVPDYKNTRLFISHAVGTVLSVVDISQQEPVLRTIDLTMMGNEFREGSQGYALIRASFSKEGNERAGRILLPFVTVDSGSGLNSMKVYGTPNGMPVAPVVAVIDERLERPMAKELSGDLTTRFGGFLSVGGAEKACTLPRAAALSSNHSLYVACLGIDQVLELDGRARDPMQVIRRRIPVPAGPTGLVVDEDRGRAIVWSQFDHRLSFIDIKSSNLNPGVVSRKPEGAFAGWPDAELARGRILFHKSNDARISGDGRACASCHPEGRDDGLVWMTPVGPHQTMMLAGKLNAPEPFGWSAMSRNLPVHVQDTLARLGGRGLKVPGGDQADFKALLAYIVSMKAPNGRSAVKARDEAAIERGRSLFEGEKQGCAGCHPGGGSDGHRYDVKSGSFKGEMFDTPVLHSIRGTAPYFHDGRYKTLEELIRMSDGKMGNTAHLPDEDVRALVLYLETL